MANSSPCSYPLYFALVVAKLPRPFKANLPAVTVVRPRTTSTASHWLRFNYPGLSTACMRQDHSSWTVRLGRRVLCSSSFICSAPFWRLVGGERQRGQNAQRGARCFGDGLRQRLGAGRLPQLLSNLDRIDPSCFPPQRLVARAMELAVVQAAERNGEFVADLAPEGEPLGEAHVVRLGGLARPQKGSG